MTIINKKNYKNFLSSLFQLKFGWGFTLIESLVAIVILIVGLWAVVQFFPLGLKITRDSQNITIVSNLVLAKIEEITALGYDDIATGTIEAKHRLSSDPQNYQYFYQRQTQVEYLDGNFNISANDLGLKKITVTVFWWSPLGSLEKSHQISTIMVKQ